VERRKKKGKKKKMREVMNDDGVGKRGEKRKERKKKKERNLVYLGLCYFGTIFELKLSYQQRIGCCKSWVLQPICIEGKFLN
jgi:hypothetical protein